MTWQDIIRDAATRRFARSGDCGPFLLARGDLSALAEELCGAPIQAGLDGLIRVQARVYVPDLRMQICVEEWTLEGKT